MRIKERQANKGQQGKDGDVKTAMKGRKGQVTRWRGKDSEERTVR